MNNSNRYEPGPSRRIFYRTLFGAIAGSILAVCLVRPLLEFFHNFAPWVGPAVIIGLVGTTMIATLLLPLIFRAGTNK